MSLNVVEITDTVIREEEPKEVCKKVFDDIGHHLINNAERLSANAVDAHAGMKIEIDIPIRDIVTLTIVNTEFVINKKQLEVK